MRTRSSIQIYRTRPQRTVIFSLALIMLICFTGCGATPRAQETETIARPTPFPKTAQAIAPNLRTHWLVGQPCAPPCWEGITPGSTRLDTAVDILNRHPSITQLQIYRSLLGNDGHVSWRWNGTDRGAGMLEFPQLDPQTAADPQDVTNPMIKWIVVSFPKSITLAEIRAVYGDPSYVAPVFFSGQTAHVGSTRFFDLSLVYLSHGFLVQTERTFGPAPKIGPTMPLANNVIFFPPTLANLDAISVSTRGWNNTSLIPWQGFQDFTSYCLQVPPTNDQPDDGVLACPNVKTTLR